MRSTAKYTLFVGFLFSSIATFIIINFGTGFKIMTAVLYLYAFSCLLGGIIGHRRALLKYSGRHSDPGLTHVFGLDALLELFSTDRVRVSLKEKEFEVEEAELLEDVVVVEREIDGRFYGISYPRKRLVEMKRE